MALTVNEIFHSIQGESSFAGLPCVFVRLTGCNLRCSYCDTSYAFVEGEPFTIHAIMDRIARYGCPLVEITGGEPLLQTETPDLARALLDEGYSVLVETNGSQDISLLDKRAMAIVDVKLPGSGESAYSFDEANFDRLLPHHEVKLVIGDREDYRVALSVYERVREQVRTVNLSPVHGRIEPWQLAEWMLGDRLRARLNLQLQKYIWPPQTRGV